MLENSIKLSKERGKDKFFIVGSYLVKKGYSAYGVINQDNIIETTFELDENDSNDLVLKVTCDNELYIVADKCSSTKDFFEIVKEIFNLELVD